jgi:hypothetical protein
LEDLAPEFFRLVLIRLGIVTQPGFSFEEKRRLRRAKAFAVTSRSAVATA